MSRSYKKTPYVGDTKTYGKQQANRTVRHKLKQAIRNQDYEYTLDGSSYKRAYEQWNICDFYSTCTWEEYWENCIQHYINWANIGFTKDYPNKDEEYKYWCAHYRGK